MPYRPSERQYRDFSVANFRAAQTEGDEQTYRVRGYFTTFSEEYPLMDDWYESIDARALDGADMSDVIFQLNHEGSPLARQRNKSLTVGIDEHGGWAEADLGGCQQGRDIYEAISNGLIDRMSFGFTIADDGFEWDEDEDGVIHSVITRISKVFDVSCVSFPANEGTEIHSARSYLDGAIEARRKQQEVLRRAESQQRRKRAAAALELARCQLL